MALLPGREPSSLVRTTVPESSHALPQQGEQRSTRTRAGLTGRPAHSRASSRSPHGPLTPLLPTLCSPPCPRRPCAAFRLCLQPHAPAGPGLSPTVTPSHAHALRPRHAHAHAQTQIHTSTLARSHPRVHTFRHTGTYTPAFTRSHTHRQARTRTRIFCPSQTSQGDHEDGRTQKRTDRTSLSATSGKCGGRGCWRDSCSWWCSLEQDERRGVTSVPQGRHLGEEKRGAAFQSPMATAVTGARHLPCAGRPGLRVGH